MKLNKSILLIILISPFFAYAQVGAFKIRNDAAIQIGYNSYKYLSFGTCSGGNPSCSTNNSGDFAIESYFGGLNFWRPWPTYAAGNFKLFLTNTGRFGVGMYPDPYDWTHILQVNGKIEAVGLTSTSYKRLKENIKPVENALHKVLKLKAVTYNYKPGLDNNKPDLELKDNGDEIKRKTIENQKYGLHEDFAKDKRIGYLAQDVEKILPEIVDKNSKGYLSLDYLDLIPMALEAIKEQQRQIEMLKTEIENVKTIDNLNQLPKNLGIIAFLYQNEPNPFDEKTTLKYKIDSDFDNAKIVVTDFWGNIKTEQVVEQKGEGTFIVNGGSLDGGTYYYSLIVNSVVVDTRIMFLIR